MSSPTSTRSSPSHNLVKLPSVSFSSALLLASLPSLDPPHFLASVVQAAAAATSSHLSIYLFSRAFNKTIEAGGVSHTAEWESVQRLLAFVYAQATHVALDMGRVLMNVDVLLKGLDDELSPDVADGMDAVFRIDGDVMAVALPPTLASLRAAWLTPDPNAYESGSIPSPSSPIAHSPLTPVDSTPPQVRVVALGGTFDHLHAGHKILLSMGAWIASEKLIIGVTAESLLRRKAHLSLLEPLSARISSVRAFVARFRPGLEVDAVPLNDVYGPTGWDPDVQALVVSEETRGGGDAVAKHRAEHNLPALRTFVIDVIGHRPEAEGGVSEKMSSTFIREWISEQEKAASRKE